MQVLLILAGRSTRFWPLAEKTLFPIAGTTLLDTQIERLKKAGLQEITLVTGAHNKNEIKKRFPTLKQVEQRDLDLGMQGALLSGLPTLKKNEPVMIVSGNDIIESDAYEELKKRAATLKSGGLILARKVKRYFPGGYLTIKKGKIGGIVEKPGVGKEPSDLINLVAHVHMDPGALLEALNNQKKGKDDAYERALAELFKAHTYKAVPYIGFWQAVKYPWHLLDLLPHLLPQNTKPQIHKTAKIHKTAVVEGPVIIGPNARVFAHASVIGPCVIGEGSIVGNNALVRESSVGENCVIGYNTEVARSLLSSNVWTHSSYLGDSVIGDDVSFGAGSVTGNLRLDEAEIVSEVKDEAIPTGRMKLGLVMGCGCRVGIHSSFAPGVKVGGGSFINSTVFAVQDIEDGTFVTMKNGEMQTRPNRHTEKKDRSAFRKKL
ncbi:MAG: sugar phosphate nucleotidyltransferase [Candidatus Peribacteraceae bacterium]